ncbi:MAG: hypothetical protein DDT29_00716 [Dehalococcoidia bacterium]|nr:hypothetical protein [Bacillota bacterium]
MIKLKAKINKTIAIPLALAELLQETSQSLGVSETSIMVAGLEKELERLNQKGDD